MAIEELRASLFGVVYTAIFNNQKTKLEGYTVDASNAVRPVRFQAFHPTTGLVVEEHTANPGDPLFTRTLVGGTRLDRLTTMCPLPGGGDQECEYEPLWRIEGA